MITYRDVVNKAIIDLGNYKNSAGDGAHIGALSALAGLIAGREAADRDEGALTEALALVSPDAAYRRELLVVFEARAQTCEGLAVGDERDRLLGKAEGLRLAMSYIQEGVRRDERGAAEGAG